MSSLDKVINGGYKKNKYPDLKSFNSMVLKVEYVDHCICDIVVDRLKEYYKDDQFKDQVKIKTLIEEILSGIPMGDYLESISYIEIVTLLINKIVADITVYIESSGSDREKSKAVLNLIRADLVLFFNTIVYYN